MISPKTIASPKLLVRQFLMPKSGQDLSECEDAIGLNAANNRFAIADGATEAFDAGNWARRLAYGWVEIDSCLSLDEFCSWLSDEGRSLQNSWNGLKLPWYSEEKARAGSFAAFVGVEVEAQENISRWRAIALGDSCMVHCRNELVLKILPITSSAAFSSTPILAASNPSAQQLAADRAVVDSGTMQRGDILILFSDAVAAWYLKLLETGDTERRLHFGSLLNTENIDDLLCLFEKERSAGQIRDDDLAVIQIEAC